MGAGVATALFRWLVPVSPAGPSATVVSGATIEDDTGGTYAAGGAPWPRGELR